MQAVAGPLHQRVADVGAQREASHRHVRPARKLLPVVIRQLLPAIQDGCKRNSAGPGLDLQGCAADVREPVSRQVTRRAARGSDRWGGA